MRRFETEQRNDTGGNGRGFRIIEAGGRYLEPLTPPPPPRAPEPYKVAASSSSLGRAHRRSSFVIIAETRPATPNYSRSTSPTLLPQTGRVSPFRGRGFKGPLPHAQSRPESPDYYRGQNGPRHGRYDRRPSVSQQNSPKRSLIPQPTRRRSVSLGKKIHEARPSPKFGRRAPVARKNSNGANEGNIGGSISRRNSLKAPDLSPIQGTPTKPTSETPGRSLRPGNSHVAKVSPLKTRNTLTVPKFIPNGNRTRNQDKSPSRGAPGHGTTGTTKSKRFVQEKKTNNEDEQKTKIPMRRGSLVNKNGLPAARFVKSDGKNPAKPDAKTTKGKSEPSKDGKNDSGEKPAGSSQDPKGNEKSSDGQASGRFIELTSPSESKTRENDLGLMNLLKQSSGATGTSSVVNTTTTTAVQPLQIEASTILQDKDTSINKNSTISGETGSSQPSPNPGRSPIVGSENSSTSKSMKTSDGGQASVTTDKKVEKANPASSATTTTTTTTNTQLTNNTSQKNPIKVNADDSNSRKKEPTNTQANAQASKDKVLQTGSSKKSLLTRNGVQDGSRGEMRIGSANPGSRANNSTSNNQKNAGKEQIASGKPANASPLQPEIKTTTMPENLTTGQTSGHRKSDSRGSAIAAPGQRNDENDDEGKRTLSRNVGGTSDKRNETAANKVASNGDSSNKIRDKNGSQVSLKSWNGLSTVSVESIRSTDTGVSLNTVRGVSSAREKKGMHMMKRPNEIETLSGNVMHLERNGEPAVLDIAETAESPQDTTRLGRLKKSLTRFRDRLRTNMRCLGCRRGHKGQTAWTGEQRAEARTTERNPPRNSQDPPKNTRCSRLCARVSNFWKNACRCTRLRESKCCKRTARVAPAESTSCCPPERRCGALCGRLFSRCKCNKSEPQHTRSIRAKHSLTSVAPPPLSEEQRAKIPEVLVEHNSVMRGAIPCLPVPLAWFCLVWNVILPGSGTIWSGLFNLCFGQPRFSISASPRARISALIVDIIVGVSQFFTVLFCLVGWGWSIWWGVMMVRLARKYKRFLASEATSSDVEARGGEPTSFPPGVPSQALRGMERAR